VRKVNGKGCGNALDEAIEEGRIKKGDKVVLVGFGGGLTWASTVIKWV